MNKQMAGKGDFMVGGGSMGGGGNCSGGFRPSVAVAGKIGDGQETAAHINVQRIIGLFIDVSG